MPKSIYQALAELEAAGGAGVLCTLISARGSTPRRAASKMLVYPDGRILGSVGGGELESRVIAAALEALQSGQSRLLDYRMSEPAEGDPGLCGGQVQVYVEPLNPRPVLLIVGAGHVGRALAHLAKWLGFRVVISDDREEFCNPQAVPDADEWLCLSPAEIASAVELTPWTYIALTTRSVDVDVACLPAFLASPVPYIGVIGSRRRWLTTREKLLSAGVSEELIARVRSPIGLELNAETPEEIAVSIMAEILMLRGGGDGKPMSRE
ncbi:MAG: XdhC family protein [Anaerolineae bacterium]|nr:MAG: XdhC family protein [Anaerolineae bacterium]